MNSQELKVRESHAFYAMDLCIAVREKDKYKTTNSTLTDRLVFKTLPIRLTLRRGMTNHEVYGQVRQVLMKFMKVFEGQSENEKERERKCEFSLVLTNSFGTVQRGTVEDNEKLIFTAAIDGSDTLAAILPFKETDLLEMKRESETNSHLRHWDIDRFQATRFTELSDLMSADDGQGDSNGQGSDRDGHRSIGLTDCFDKFVEKEQLGENDTIFCSTCKAHTAPTKKMDIWSAPDILILHLKRFQIIPGDAGFHRREKITDFIQFPIEALDLSKYVKGPIQVNANNASQGSPCLYDLHAVSHHMGGLGGGHYVATCKHPSNGKWYDCNDSSVSETTADSAVSASAYVLFYQRR
jgi:hypothetical protein